MPFLLSYPRKSRADSSKWKRYTIKKNQQVPPSFKNLTITELRVYLLRELDECGTCERSFNDLRMVSDATLHTRDPQEQQTQMRLHLHDSLVVFRVSRPPICSIVLPVPMNRKEIILTPFLRKMVLIHANHFSVCVRESVANCLDPI